MRRLTAIAIALAMLGAACTIEVQAPEVTTTKTPKATTTTTTEAPIIAKASRVLVENDYLDALEYLLGAEPLSMSTAAAESAISLAAHSCTAVYVFDSAKELIDGQDLDSRAPEVWIAMAYSDFCETEEERAFVNAVVEYLGYDGSQT